MEEKTNKVDVKAILNKIKQEFSSGQGFKKYKQKYCFKIVVDYPDTGYGSCSYSNCTDYLKQRASEFSKENDIRTEHRFHPNYGYLQLQFYIPIASN